MKRLLKRQLTLAFELDSPTVSTNDHEDHKHSEPLFGAGDFRGSGKISLDQPRRFRTG